MSSTLSAGGGRESRASGGGIASSSSSDATTTSNLSLFSSSRNAAGKSKSFGTEGRDVVLHSLLERRHQELRAMFEALDADDMGRLAVSKLEQAMILLGLNPKRKDIAEHLQRMDQNGDGFIDFPEFTDCMLGEATIVQRAINHALAIPNFIEFTEQLTFLLDSVRDTPGGELCPYIPALQKVHPDLLGFSLCSIDGQIFTYGDAQVDFTMQASILPILYLIACEEMGVDEFHDFIGREPSGVKFNAFALNAENKPHNPMISTGGILTCSLIRQETNIAERFSYILDFMSELAGGLPISFNQPVYLSEKENGERNFALAYYLAGNGVHGIEDSKVTEVLDFYFQVCATQCNTVALSVVAATLANGGICPITHRRIVSMETVKSCLSIMYSCGMADFSGEWAFRIGVPAKSGISGVMMVVIPNRMGFAIFSPRVDERGNSVRGIEFCHRFTSEFRFDIFEYLMAGRHRDEDD